MTIFCRVVPKHTWELGILKKKSRGLCSIRLLASPAM